MVTEDRRYGAAAVLYGSLFLALTFPYWGQGHVVAPHRNTIELGLPPEADGLLENRKFSDYSSAYIPELQQHLDGGGQQWLATWTSRNELGRPLYHLSGFSPAYLPAWVLAKLRPTPYAFITVLTFGQCFLAGLFIFLYCRELRFAPWVAALSAGGLASCPMFMYWLTFPMFPAVWCWSAGVLYALARLQRTLDLWGWSVLVFSVYSLLMTAYPQPVVFQAYLLTGYGLVLVKRLRREAGMREVGLYLAAVGSAGIVGGLCALPVYFDLVYTASQSARTAPDPTFFLAPLPAIHSFQDAGRFIAVSTFPEIFGEPMSPAYPLRYDGVSLTPLLIFLAVLGGLDRFRECWGWWAAVGMLCALAMIHPLYLIGVKHLGFHLSRSTPLGSIALPATVIAAHGAESLARNARIRTRGVLPAAAVVCVTLAFAVGFGRFQGLEIRWNAVAGAIPVVACCVAQFRSTRPWLLLAALICMGACISRPLMLRQDPSQIARTSPLVEAVRRHLPPGSRFAVVGTSISPLPPNLNAALELPSVHSYDSLSPKRYHTLIQALGGEVKTYGRWNDSISPDFDGDDFWMSNVGLVISTKGLNHPNLIHIEELAGLHLYRVLSRMGTCAQFAFSADTNEGDVARLPERQTRRRLAVERLEDHGDSALFQVAEADGSLLVLSQMYHRDWQAAALNGRTWEKAATLPVNGAFQGVALPPRVQRVALRFEPAARHAWMSHWFLAGLLVAVLLRSSRRIFTIVRASPLTAS